MDDILIDLLWRRREHLLKHRTKPQTIKLTESEKKQFRAAMKKQAENIIPPPLSLSSELRQSYTQLVDTLEHTDRIFGMQIE